MRVLVTGGTGFIGSHLVETLLGEGHEVRCLVRDRRRLGWLAGLSGVSLAQGDVADPSSLRECLEGVDHVYHAAGLTRAPSRISAIVPVTSTPNVIARQ